MTVKSIGPNQTVVVKQIHDVTYLFLVSYQTPVAFLMNTENTVYVTETYHSKTTSRHINLWSGNNDRKPISQADIDFLFEMAD